MPSSPCAPLSQGQRETHTAHHPEILQGRWLLGGGGVQQTTRDHWERRHCRASGCFLNSLILTLATLNSL